MKEKFNEKVIKKTFSLWTICVVIDQIILRNIVFRIDYFIEHFMITNIISTIFYLLIFLIWFSSIKQLKEDYQSRRILSIWGFLFLIMLFQNSYSVNNIVHLFASGSPAAPGIPIETITATIGTFITYLLSRQLIFKYLSIFNIVLIVLAVIGTLYSLDNPFRLATTNVLHYSIVLLINLLVISIGYNRLNADSDDQKI